MSSPGHIIYTPRPGASPELEAAALAAAYRYILECHAKKQAIEANSGEDAAGGGEHKDGLSDASE